MSVAAANVRAVITIDDVRRIASVLPRSSEAVVRDQIRLRAGRLVYAAFSRNELRELVVDGWRMCVPNSVGATVS